MRRKHPRHCSKFIDDIINIFTVRQHQCHWHWQRHYVATSIHKWMTMSRSKRLMINMDTNCNGIPFCQRILHMIEMLPVLNVLYRQLRLNLCENSPLFLVSFSIHQIMFVFFLLYPIRCFHIWKKKPFDICCLCCLIHSIWALPIILFLYVLFILSMLPSYEQTSMCSISIINSSQSVILELWNPADWTEQSSDLSSTSFFYCFKRQSLSSSLSLALFLSFSISLCLPLFLVLSLPVSFHLALPPFLLLCLFRSVSQLCYISVILSPFRRPRPLFHFILALFTSTLKTI